MTNKLVIDRYTEDIYPCSTIYVIKNLKSINDINKYFSTQEDENLETLDALGLTYKWVKHRKSKEICHVVVINPLDKEIKEKTKKDNSFLIGICVHEALHVTADILNNAGISLEDNTQEAYCYFVEFITKCIYKTMLK